MTFTSDTHGSAHRDSGSSLATAVVLDYLAGAADTDLPPDVAATARQLIADYVGVTVAGSRTPPAQHVTTYASSRSGNPTALIIGDGALVPVELAALANGTAAHALDFDDDEPRAFVGHPSSPVLSAAVAVAQARGSSGRDLLRAFTAGTEVEYRIGEAVNPVHYNDGWHATSTLGVFGAVAACAVLSGLDRQQTARALGMAGSAAAGLKRNFGTMTKSFHVGCAAEAAVRATRMSAAGFTADETIFDGHLSALNVFSRNEVPPLEVFDDLGHRFMLVDPGINIKRYPACSSTHPAVDVIVELARRIPDLAREVRTIDCYVAPGTEDMLQYGIPNTPLEAKFSMQFCLAAAAVHGNLLIDSFSEEAISDPTILNLARRTRMLTDAGLDRAGVAVSTAARVVVGLPDGREEEATAWEPKGSPALPLTRNELLAKYRACCEPILGAEQTERSFGRILALSADDKISDLVSDLAPRSGNSPLS